MERYILTPEQQAVVDAWQADPANAQFLVSPVMIGANIVIGDQIQLYSDWPPLLVVGGNSVNGGTEEAWCYFMDWQFLGLLNILDDITDRLGPNGETMPVIDPVQMQARLAAKAAGQNPKHAAHGHHAAPRTVQDFLAAQTPEVREQLEKLLKKHHLLHGKP